MGHRTKWPGNNPEKVKELWQKYQEERRAEINEGKRCIIKLRWIVLFAGVRLRKIYGQGMLGVRSKGVERGGGDGKVGGRECELKSKYFDTFILTN